MQILGRRGAFKGGVGLTADFVMQEDQCDIKALIEFESVVKGDKGDTLNALRFNILVEDV